MGAANVALHTTWPVFAMRHTGYDLIICNPPYFVRSYLPPGAEQAAMLGASPASDPEAVKRALARHAGAAQGSGLTYEVRIMSHTNKHTHTHTHTTTIGPRTPG